MKELYCLYMHISPDAMRYIGKTSKKPKERWKQGTRYTKNKDFFDDIVRHGGEGQFLTVFDHYILSPAGDWFVWKDGMSIEETNFFTQEIASDLEQKWIDYYKTLDPKKIYNRSSGGDQGFTYDPIAKERNRQAHTGLYDGEKNPAYGMKQTEEVKHYLSELAKRRTGQKNSFYGKHHSDETKEKNRQSHLGLYDGENNPFYGKSHSTETKRCIGEKTRKPVDQFDLSGRFIRQYSSVSEAAAAVGRSISTLSQNCIRNRGEKLHHCAGYVFRFSKDKK